jgi:hypothetical protein
MKHKSLLFSLAAISGLWAGAPAVVHADVGVDMLVGILYDSGGAPLADGKLIQLIADTAQDGFSSPTSTSYVSGDDVVLYSFSVDSSILGTAGTSQASTFSINYANYSGLSAGDPLLLRWFDVDYVSGATGPGISTFHFGQYRDGFSNASISSDAWVTPSDTGGALVLNFITQSFGDSNSISDTSALASNLITPIPEPAHIAGLAGLAVLGSAFYIRRRSRD